MPYFKRLDEEGNVVELGEVAEIPKGGIEISKEEFERIRKTKIRREDLNRALSLLRAFEADIRSDADLFREYLQNRSTSILREFLTSVDWESFLRDHQGDLGRFLSTLDPQILNGFLNLIFSQSSMIKLLLSAIEELQSEVQRIDSSWSPKFSITGGVPNAD